MRIFAALVVSFVVALVVRAQPLPTDPRLVTGELDNGMKYVVRKHATPPGRAQVHMLVSTGSTNETERQRGIAHFTEHMAFNGTTNFPPGSVVAFFESLGLTFGQHQNAGTNFDATVYQLALNKNDVETLDKALTFMNDVARGVLFPAAEIEKERGVILEEKRARTSPQYRVFIKSMEQLLPSLAARDPIGTEETIKGVTQQDFKDYYGAWYTPSNMTMVVVADMDEAVVVQRIKAKFSGGEKAPIPADRDLAIKARTEPLAVVATDPELTRATVGFNRITAARPPVTTKAQSRVETVENLAMSAFNRRIEQKVAEGTMSFLYGGASVQDIFRAATIAGASAVGEPSKWKEMLRDLGTELARARKFGFTPEEIEFVKKQALADAEQTAATEGTEAAEAIVQQLVFEAQAGVPMMSAAQRLEVIREELSGIGAEQASSAFASAFEPAGMAFSVQLPASSEVPTHDALLAMGREILATDVKADAQATKVDKLMDAIPAPGQFTEVSEHAPSQVWSAWLSNGIPVHYRFMDYKKDEVIIAVTLAGGLLFESAENRGATSAAMEAWNRKATSKLTSNNITDLMTGKKISVSGGSGQDTMQVVITGNPVDLETGLQVAHLMLTDPKIEEAAFKQWKERQLQQIEAQKNNPQAYFGVLAQKTIFPAGEARFQALTRAQVERLTIETAQAWLRKLIAESSMEVCVVGDVPKERALELVATYLGSLSPRERIATTTNAKARTLARTPGPRDADESIESTLPAAIVLGGFFGTDRDNRPDARALDIAARVLSTRMNKKIREEEQLVYGIGANSQPSEGFKGWGLFLAASPTQPEKAGQLRKRIFDHFDDLARDGITDEELDVAKKQAANDFDENMKEPGFWSQVLGTKVYRGRNLDTVLGEPAAFEALTTAQIKDAFVKYYTKDATMSIILRPKAKDEAAPAAEKK